VVLGQIQDFDGMSELQKCILEIQIA